MPASRRWRPTPGRPWSRAARPRMRPTSSWATSTAACALPPAPRGRRLGDLVTLVAPHCDPDGQPARLVPRHAERPSGRHLADRRARLLGDGHEDDRARRRRHRHHDRVLSGQARPRGASGRPPGRRGDGDELRQRRRPAHQRGRALVAARDAEKHSEVAGQGRRADAAALQRAARNVALGARVHPQLLARALPPQHHDQSPPLVLHAASASRRSARRPGSTTI